jgi:hypothetical protein
MGQTTAQQPVSVPTCPSVLGLCRWSAPFPRYSVTLTVAWRLPPRRPGHLQPPNVVSLVFLAANFLHNSVRACQVRSRFRRRRHRSSSTLPSRLRQSSVQQSLLLRTPSAKARPLDPQCRSITLSPPVATAPDCYPPMEITKTTTPMPRIPLAGTHHSPTATTTQPSSPARNAKPPSTKEVPTSSPPLTGAKSPSPTTRAPSRLSHRAIAIQPLHRSPPLQAPLHHRLRITSPPKHRPTLPFIVHPSPRR